MRKPINICFSYYTPFHPERGGIGRVTHTLTLELQKRGYNVFYLIDTCAGTVKYEYDYPAPLEYLPSHYIDSKERVDCYINYLKRNKIDILIDQSGNFSDCNLLEKVKSAGFKIISVLHSNPWVSYNHIWYSDVYPLRNGTFVEKLKRIARICLYFKIKNQNKISRIRNFKKLLPVTDIVCMLSSNFYHELDEICPGYSDKYYTIPNPNSYYENQTSQSVPKRKQLLFVGLFGPQKNEIKLVNIWKDLHNRYPDWELVMVGDGNESRVKRLKHIAKNIKNIRFTGFQNPLPFQQSASILCMTSIYEGWPMVLTEAMQCGAVPIAFNSFAAITDIIEDEVSGILVEPFDIKEYKKKLCELMDNDDKRHIMSIAARESISRYDVDNIVDQWEGLFDSVLKGK